MYGNSARSVPTNFSRCHRIPLWLGTNIFSLFWGKHFCLRDSAQIISATLQRYTGFFLNGGTYVILLASVFKYDAERKLEKEKSSQFQSERRVEASEDDSDLNVIPRPCSAEFVLRCLFSFQIYCTCLEKNPERWKFENNFFDGVPFQ